MWTVLIVDDEYYAREGLQRILTLYGKDQFKLIDAVDNPFRALEIIWERRPNIVLTDIQMPAMSGLELAKAAAESGSRFIIVTGHNDFVYAKEALRLSAADYLLKPVNPDELMAALNRAVSALSHDNSAVGHRLIAYLRYQTEDTSPLQRYPYAQFQLILVEAECEYLSQAEDYSKVMQHLKERVQSYTGHDCGVLPVHTNQVILLGDGAWDYLPLLRSIQEEVRSSFRVHLSIALPPPGSARDLPARYATANELLASRFFLGRGRIITELPQPARSYEPIQAERAVREVLRALESCNTRQALQHLENLFKLLYDMQVPKAALISSFMTIFLALKDALDKKKLLPSSFEQYNPMHHDWSFSRLCEAARSMTVHGLDLLRTEQGDVEDDAVERAIQYINLHFCEEISLKTLAEEVFLNASYLSRRLKEKLGMNYSKYITYLRVEKAKTLLLKGYPVERAAKEVGYPNYRHFSEVFKLYSGDSPSRYLSR